MEDNINESAPSVRAVGIKFGLISAGVSVFFFLVLVLTGMNAFDNKWGWVNVPISIVLIVLAHKQFKDDGDGFMSYGQGVGIGFWIALISVAIAGAFTFVYMHLIDASVMDQVKDMQRIKFEEQGMSDSQIETALVWVGKIFWPAYFFFGIFFGVLIAVIVSIFTQKKNPQPVF
jgi:Protein of unknown function (DUF4199)